MKFTLPLRNDHVHDSLLWHRSSAFPKVEYALRSISLLQRIDLLTRGRELAQQSEFLNELGEPDLLSDALSDLLVQRMYLEWGVAGLRGLEIDGKQATLAELLLAGPEELSTEIFGRLQDQLGLTEDERKN